MNILLIYPEFPDNIWSFKHALKFIRKKASTQPLGLLTVAAMLPRNGEKRLVDLNVNALKDKTLPGPIMPLSAPWLFKENQPIRLLHGGRAPG